MANLPSDIAAQVLDAIGSDYVLGDISEGSREAQVILRAYLQCIQQLLRSANWDFARKEAPLLLLADATGQTPNVGSVVPSGYVYEYLYPTDCMKIRFIPWNYQIATNVPPGNIQPVNPSLALESNLGQSPNIGRRQVPAKFVIATDPNYAAIPGQLSWDTQGQSPASSTVILTNVKNACAVYTALMLYPSTWDPLFRAALVAYLASEVALPLTKDKALGRSIRDEQIQITKAKIEQARLVDGNEGATSSDIPVDWMRTRRIGGAGGAWGGYGWGDQGLAGFGGGGGWDSCGFADGSAY